VRSSEDTPLAVVVSRQPILDGLERIVAFELLTPAGESREATARLLAHAFGDIGLPRLAGSRAVHVNVSREFLLAVRPLPIDPARVVLEIGAGSRPTTTCGSSCARRATRASASLSTASTPRPTACSTSPTASRSRSPRWTRPRSRPPSRSVAAAGGS